MLKQKQDDSRWQQHKEENETVSCSREGLGYAVRKNQGRLL
jgi:hypothetical protein